MNHVDEHAITVLRNAMRGRRKIPRLSKLHDPSAAIMKYRYALDLWMNDVEQLAKNLIYPNLPKLVAEANPQQIARDDWGSDFAGMMYGFNERVDNLHYDFRQISNTAANETAAHNRQQWHGMIQRAFGVDYIGSEPWLQPALKVFAVNNAEQITGMKQDAVSRVTSWVTSGIRNGDRAEDIQAKIQEQFGVVRSRAAFIARDQLAKLNGQLNMMQQTSVGVEEYTWRGMMDDRERESHREHEGKVYRWDDPPAETGAPGEDYQCRCWAEPVLDHLLEGSDEDAQAQEAA